MIILRPFSHQQTETETVAQTLRPLSYPQTDGTAAQILRPLQYPQAGTETQMEMEMQAEMEARWIGIASSPAHMEGAWAYGKMYGCGLFHVA